MKNLFLAFVASCWVSVSLNAQIVVTASNYGAFFNSGSTQITDTTPTISPGTAGANVTWNFAALNSHVTTSNTFMAASAGLKGSSFPLADVCLKQDTHYYYYDSSSTKLQYYGYAGNFLGINTNDAIVYSNPETILTFPSTFNTGFTDVSTYDNLFFYNTTYQGYFVDSIRQKSTTTTTSVMDAWGTITTPNATLACLRQNISKHTIDTTWAKVFVGGFHYWIELYNDDATTQSYSYISNVGGGLIATIEYYADSTAIAEVRWNPVTIPTVTLSAQTNLLCNGANTGSATISATGGVTPYTYIWSNGQTGTSATGLTAGTYTVTVKDAVNSSPTLTVTITQPSAVVANVTSLINPNCGGCTNGSASVLGSGGTSPYTYAWSNGQTSTNATGLGVGSYSVTITDANSCTGNVTVAIDTVMVINASDYNTFFSPGNTLIVDTAPTVTPGAAGANVTWYLFSMNSHLTKTNSFLAPASGLLGSSFTNASVCMKEDTNYYYYDSTETKLDYWGYAGNILDIGTNDAIVYNNPETILTFPSTYNTSFSDVSSYDNYYLYNTTYQGYFVDSIRQKATTTTTSVIDGWGKVVTPNGTIPCLRQNVMKNTIDTTWAKIFLGGYHYWIELYHSNDNVQSYSYISNSGGGLIASIEYEPNSTVVAQATWNPVTVPTATISAQTNVSCNGSADGTAIVTATGGTTPYSYLWGNGQTTATASGLSIGYHSVTVTDALNGTATATVNITQPSVLFATITNQANATCLTCTDGSATITGSGGTAPYSYSWANGQTNSTSTGLGIGTATVTITDANSCTVTSSVAIDTVLVINSTDYTFFQYGTDLITDTVPTVTPGSAGANVTWDLSALNTHLLSANTFMAPSSGVLGGSYPLSDVCVNQDTLYNYFDTSITKVEYYGTSGNILDNSANNAQVYSNPATVLTFPLTYNTTFTDVAFHDNTYGYNAMYQGVWVDSLREKETITTTSVIDGWGTIKTPNETFTGLRQNVTKHHVDSTWAKIFVGNYHYWIEVYNDTFNVQFYNYISDASGNNIVSIEYFADSNAIVEAKWNPMTLPVVTASQTNVTCSGLSNGTATASVTGGKTPYTYSWNTIPVQATAGATGLAAGSYTVTILDSYNNTSSVSVTITEPTALTASISGTTAPACGSSNGNATVTAGGGTTGYSYLWSNSQTTATATGLGAGSYMVTVTDAMGCVDSVQASVSNVGAPTINEDSLTNVDCNGNSTGIAYMSATGGTGSLSYVWNTTPAQNDSTATGLSAGIYVFSVTDAVPCVAVQSVTITEPDALIASILSQTNVSCAGDSNGVATVGTVGGISGYSYFWSTTPGQSTVSATGLKAGGYTVTVTDANSCTTTALATISQPIALTASISSQTNITCFGSVNGTATATGVNGTTPFSYNWSTTPPQTTATATGLDTLTYTVTVTDANGCSNTATTTITEPTALTASSSVISNVGCNGNADGSAVVVAGGGTTGYSYLWSNTQTNDTASALSLGIYTVTVTDANGCTKTASASISEPAALNASITSQTNVSCFGDSNGVATVTPVGGTTAYSYSWNTTPAQLTVSATGLKQGSYTVVVTDSKGCTKNATAAITQPAALTASNSSTNVSCAGGTNGSVTVTGGGGTAPYYYSWNTSPVQTNATATGLDTGIYTVTITDAKSCTKTATTTITQPQPLTAAISQTNLLCNGVPQGTATVTAGGGTTAYTYMWNTSPFQTVATATGLASGNYTITVTDAKGCTKTATTFITQPSVLNAGISAQTNLDCNGDSDGDATVAATGGTTGYSYSWNTVPPQATATATGLIAGSYIVTVVDTNGCSKTATATITEPTILSATISAQTDLLCYGDSDGAAVVTAGGGTSGYSYNWGTTPAQTTDTATGLTGGSVDVTVTDAKGCALTVTATIAEPAILTAVISTETGVTCNGDSDGVAVVLAGGGISGYTYQWNSTPAQNTDTATALPPGTFDVTVTDANGCIQTAFATIAEPDVVTAVISTETGVSCNGDTDGMAVVVASGGTSGYTYDWNTTPVQSTDTATGLSGGTFDVVVTDANGCTQTASATITEPSALTATASVTNDVSCFGGNDGSTSVAVTGGTTDYSYVWANGSPNQTAGQLVAGANGVTVTDANGCTTTSSATVTEPTALATTTSSTGDSGSGNGTATVTVTGGTTAYSYNWSTTPPQITQTATGLAIGTYTVTVTDGNGCTITATETVLDVLVSTIENLNYSVKAYPNPSQGSFSLEITSLIDNDCQLMIFDIKGQVVLEQNLKLVSGISNHPISINAAHQGIYVIRLTSKDGVAHIPVTVME